MKQLCVKTKSVLKNLPFLTVDYIFCNYISIYISIIMLHSPNHNPKIPIIVLNVLVTSFKISVSKQP
uniref:Uncharacterized protein n=1 Tax=Helianthus annuus TaxID=4232 RepID=A0A251V439_HELAN